MVNATSIPSNPVSFAMLTLFLTAFPLLGGFQDPEPAEVPKPTVLPDGVHELGLSATVERTGKFGGVEVRYTANAKEWILRDGDGKAEAGLFATSYVRTGGEASSRPVTFLWNGGPGSSSVWLHMGVFGPKRVDVPSDAQDDGAAPFPIVDNPGAFLDLSDIVFVDPVGTGFSRPLGDKKGKDFYGVGQDAKAMARFIRMWISHHKRWNSPKFIGGESYGTTRSAAVLRELERGYNDVSINGVLLISTILDFAIENHSPGNELPNVMHLPTMAATAHYHGKAGVGISLEAFVQEAREYAQTEYLQALMQGNALPDEEFERVATRLMLMTGLSERYIRHANLRLRPAQFQKELLREQGYSVGRLDSRYKGRDLDAVGGTPDSDPSFYGIDGAYTAAINQYLRADLNWEGTRPYNIIGLGAAWDWDVPGASKDYLSVAPFVGEALRQNNKLQIFVAQGYYDFATPFHAAEFSLNRPGMDSDRIHFAYYESGHMMYVHHPSLHKLQKDVREFYARVLAQ